ncbi:MAG: hypothetical protein FWE37_08945 [Spirochaetaceae bacterium]|nr:hypothetical protein [Spirochaetaceae bacterium]
MITLKQVEQLNQKIKRAIALIDMLRKENSDLVVANSRLLLDIETLQNDLKRSNARFNSLSDDQELLEQGIQGAIDQLTTVENHIISSQLSAAKNPEEPPVAIPVSKEPELTISNDNHSEHEDDKEPSLDIY